MQFQKPIFVICSVVGSIFFSANFSKLIAQTAPMPPIESPNTASLGRYGDIPVSYFTGVPNIGFPIYDVKVGNIKLPISLNYHPGSVKPNEHPGWVGMGWNVAAYGSITRKYHYDDDERDIQTPTFPAYYPNPYTANYGASFINTSDWETPARVYYVNTVNNGKGYDIDPDEFSFNFGNYSGSFFYTANGWQVASKNPNIKVEVLGFLSASEIRTNILQYTAGQVSANSDQSRTFRGFILTTEEGTKYTFGYIAPTGADVDCGIEFSAAIYGIAPASMLYGANTWLLRRMEDINGEVVTFDYQRKHPVCSLAFYSSEMNYACVTNTGSTSYGNSSTTFNNQINTAKHSGRLIYPVYLKKITSSKEIIDFTISETTELRYTDDFLKYDNGLAFNLDAIGTNNDPSNLKWYKLDDIAVRNKTNDILFKFKFIYNNVASERLTLNSFAEQDRFGNNVKTYQFLYNNIAGLPPYGGDQTDHWGFYNGVLMNGRVISSAATNRNTNQVLVTRGLLTSVTYPTGGKTEYVWEPNSAANVVAYDRQSLTPYTPGFVGGARIKEIRNYADLIASPLVTKYFYVKNFSAGVDPLTLSSSGILNGTPEYYFNIPTRTSYTGLVSVSYDIASINSLVNYSYNGSYSHVGYSEVVEQKPDNSYTKYFFTNFDQDLNSQVHWDKKPGVLGWILTGSAQDRYVPMSSLEHERGNLLKTSVFKNDNTLLTDTRLYYRSDATRFDNFIKRYDRNRSTPVSCSYAEAFMLLSAFKTFFYNYYVVKKEQTDYDMTGANPVSSVTDFEYNATNQLSKSTTTVSNGRKLITRYKYPSDFAITAGSAPEVLALQSMKTKNIIAQPVEVQTIQEVNTVQKLLKGKIVKYKDMGSGLIKPSEELETELLEPSPDLTQASVNASNQFVYHPDYKSKLLYDKYELNGNIKQLHKVSDNLNSYIWDYQLAYPVAEIINSTESETAYTSFEAEGTGNWAFIGLKYTDGSAPTGSKVYNLGTGSVVSNALLNIANAYTVSYWTKNAAAFSITGTVSGYPVMGRTLNGWTYFEHKITGQSQITLAGTGSIDELRLYPFSAQMVSYTYTPLVGITTQCSANNNINYYEYDDYNRLILIRDQDKNIIKKVCYNYNGQTENCNIFFNTAQSGIYTKNCSSGYIGNAVTYTVPAYTYSSTIDVYSANAKATNDVQLNGQAYANAIGTCTANSISAVQGYNAKTASYLVKFTNTVSGLYYSFYLNQNTLVPYTLGTVPSGIYNVQFYPAGTPLSATFNINGYTQYSTGATFYNISITATSTASMY